MSLDVSVIIVNWNTAQITCGCLASVYEQTRDVSFEVIVVDNASSDGSAERIQQQFPQVILIENTENRGFAAANNQGMAVAQGRYVLLLNPDTVVLDGAIQKAIAFAERHPEAAVVGCQVWENESKLQPTCFSFPSLGGLFLRTIGLSRMFPKSRLWAGEMLGWWDRTTEREVDVVSGMFMLVRSEAIQQVGRMDETYFIYAEETDWCWRFKKAGWKCLFTPEARIIHLDGGGKSTDQLSIRMFVQLHKSLLIFFRKNRGVLSFMLAKLFFVLCMGLRTIVWRLLSLGGRKDRVHKYQQSSALLTNLVWGCKA
ncbi:MAG: glycosyltransferase family 2 protein [Sedimentisphaerales bacterium]|nr:glycosyltransferase family 2 protein [Sedimentisphaerales bacterium]